MGYKYSSTMTRLVGDDQRMTGDEIWPISGNLVRQDRVAKMIAKCKGLRKHWDCIAKAQIVQKEAGFNYHLSLPEDCISVGQFSVVVLLFRGSVLD